MEKTDRQVKLTACVLTYNNADTIERCLQSVSFADEVLVVDSGSSDDTVARAKPLATRIIERDWPGFIAQRAYGIEAALGDWMLFLDADEEVSPELAAAVRKVVADNPENVDGFLINRRSFYLGRWQRQWYPDAGLNLFRRQKARIEGKEPHAQVAVEGKVKSVSGDILHFPYKDISHHLDKINYMSSVAAESYKEEDRRVGPLFISARVAVEFIKKYFLKGGFLDGRAGFIAAVNSCFYVFAKYAKLLELKINNKTETP